MMFRIRRYLLAALVVAGATASPGAARADMLFTGSDGSLSAQADFALSGNILTITLTNTSPNDVLVPGDVLTGLFFNTAHTLTPLSAALNTGSSVVDGSIINNVGEGWQYRASSSGMAHGKDAGISAAGLSLFGPNGNFYTPGQKIGGLDYGIVSAGGIGTGANTGVTGHGPLIQNSIVFTLTAGLGFVLTDLGNSVVFQYGTSTDEPSFTSQPPITGFNGSPEAPEPSSMVLALTAIAAIAYRRTRQR